MDPTPIEAKLNELLVKALAYAKANGISERDAKTAFHIIVSRAAADLLASTQCQDPREAGACGCSGY
jgi:hypothetical protein